MKEILEMFFTKNVFITEAASFLSPTHFSSGNFEGLGETRVTISHGASYNCSVIPPKLE